MSQRTTAIHHIEQNSAINLYTFIAALTALVAAGLYAMAGQRQAALVVAYGVVVLVATQVTDWYRSKET